MPVPSDGCAPWEWGPQLGTQGVRGRGGRALLGDLGPLSTRILDFSNQSNSYEVGHVIITG